MMMLYTHKPQTTSSLVFIMTTPFTVLHAEVSKVFKGKQSLAVEQLAEYIGNCRGRDSDTNPRIYLLAGPASTGKTTAARAFAEMVNSVDGRLDMNVDLTQPCKGNICCEIRMESKGKTEANSVFKTIADAITKVHEEEAASPHIPSSAEFLSGQTALKRLVFFFDEIEKVGGRQFTTAKATTPQIWTKLMQFFETGGVEHDGSSYKLPYNWRPVIIMATNLMSEHLTPECEVECRADDRKLKQLYKDVETKVRDTIFDRSPPLSSRILGFTVLFFAYTPEVIQSIVCANLKELLIKSQSDFGYKRHADVNLLTTERSLLREQTKLVNENLRTSNTFGHPNLDPSQTGSVVFIGKRRMPNRAEVPRIQLVLTEQVSTAEISMCTR